MKAGVLAEPVLVGREKELDELMHCLDSVFEGKGTTIFISGEAGAGKTRLTNEFLKIVREKQIAVLSGRCFSDVAVPYFPFMEAFNAYFSAKNDEKEGDPSRGPGTRSGLKQADMADDEESEIKTWLAGPKQAGGSGKLQSLTPQAWKDLSLATVTKTLISISRRKLTILFIDDLHWADSASLSLLHYIASSIASARVLLLATYRSEELSADAEGRPHPLGEALRMMRRSDLFKEIPLLNLDRDNVAALAEKMVGGRLHSELAERLADESRGNPLFIVESLRMLSEQGSLVKDREQWRLSIDEVGIPTKIKDIILRRLGILAPTQRRVLSLASAIGDKFDADLLGAVLDQDSLEVLETLNAIAQSSSLIRCEGSYFSFDHSKIRDAIYSEISPPLKKGYHARIAERMESRGKNAEDLPVSELAYHYAQAGNTEKAVKYSLAAGDNAISRFSNSEAIRHFKYVLQAVEGVPKYAKEKSAALERLGDALFANDLHEEAVCVFEQLANIETGSIKLRAFRKAMEAAYFRRKDAQTIELAKKAEEYAASDRLEYARIQYHKARAQGLMGDVESARQQMEELVQVFGEEHSLSDAAHALLGAGKFSENLKEYEKGLGALQRSNSLLEEINDPYSQMELNSNIRAPFFFRFGLFQQAIDILEKNVEIAIATGHYRRIATAYSILSTYLEFAGNIEEAMKKMLKAAEYMQKTDSPRLGHYLFPHLLRQYSKLGDIQSASQYFDKVSKQSIKTTLSPEANPIALWAIAVFFSATSQTGKALELFEEILESFLPSARNSIWAIFYKDFIKEDYAQALAKQGRTDEAQKINQSIREYNANFEHVNILADVMVPTQVQTGKEFEFRLDLVNVAKTSGILIKVENLLPAEFEAVSLPSFGSLRDGMLEIQDGTINPFQVKTVKLNLKAKKIGPFNVTPTVVYVDDQGQTKTCQPKAVTVTVHPPGPSKAAETSAMPGRVTTGFAQLNDLLLGGIPVHYAVMLASPSIDERSTLVKAFLEAGASAGETIFYITDDPANTSSLAERYPSNVYLFVCNPQADAIVQSSPNVFKLKGVESLTEIDIALTKAFRTLPTPPSGSRRICIEIVSDALLQHHALITRKWLGGLLPTLKAKGFTILGVVDPQMHPPEEVQAILSLFDGEIRVAEKETPQGSKRTLRVKRLFNQRFSDSEVVMDKGKLAQ